MKMQSFLRSVVFAHVAPVISTVAVGLLFVSVMITKQAPISSFGNLKYLTSSADGLVLIASPNPIPVCDNSGVGNTAFSWTVAAGTSIELRKDNQAGQLLYQGTGSGSFSANNIANNSNYNLYSVVTVTSYETRYIKGRGWVRIPVTSTQRQLLGSTTTTHTQNGCSAQAGKKSFHRFTGQRAGRFSVGGAWNVQDFAWHLVNTSSQDIEVKWEMVSDNSSFVFYDGGVGKSSRVMLLPAGGALSLNVAGAESYPFMVKAGTNFTGATEFTGCIRGTSPCSPGEFYAYLLPSTPVKVGADPDLTWFQSWDEWSDRVVSFWDINLKAFVIPYTNYWHNTSSWPKGWQSNVVIKNNSIASAEYTVKHVPDSYAQRSGQSNSCNYQPYIVQTAKVVVAAGATSTISLASLFGWPADVASYMEGYLVVTPPTGMPSSQSVVHSDVVPNTSSSGYTCLTFGGYGVVTAIKNNPNTLLSGNVDLVARVAADRGVGVTSVKFYVDDVLIGSGNIGSTLAYDSNLRWDSTNVSNGSHSLSVKAFRGSAQVGNISNVSVNIENFNLRNGLVVTVDGGKTTKVNLPGTYTLHAETLKKAPFQGALDARYSVCDLVNQNACSAPVVVSWQTLNEQGDVVVNLGSDFAPGMYKAEFRPAGQTTTSWSNQISVFVSR